MKYVPFTNLQTERLLLRQMRRSDAENYFHRLGGSEVVTRYMLFVPHRDPEESVKSVEKHVGRYETGCYYHWVITEQGKDELIGVISLLRFDEEKSNCSFAYMLGEDFWGMGYGTEAVKAVFDFAFSQLDIQRIEADHMAENPASGAVMRKVGMQYTGMEFGKYEKNGTLHDALCYEITKKQWEMRPVR